MVSRGIRVLWVVGVILAFPVVGYAQEAVLTGAVTDTSGAVMPGVIIRAVHQASGNSFEAVTDQRGTFRMAVRVGTYRISGDDRLLIRDILHRTGSIRTTTTLVRGNGDPIPIEFRAVLVARDPLVLEMALRPIDARTRETGVRRTVATETV